MSFPLLDALGRPPGSTSNVDGQGFVIPTKRKRGRPKKVRDDDNISVVTTSTYDSLPDDDEGDAPIPKRQHLNRTKKPPPIVIRKIDPKTLEEKLVSIKIPRENLHKRLTRDGGANIYVSTNDEHRSLRAHLDAQEIQYVTYTPDDEKSKMYVLYGLPEFDTDEILNLIKTRINVTPTSVKKMKITRPAYPGHTNYIIYVPKQLRTSLRQMKEISGMFGYHVFWANYYRQGPTQCFNCQGFFHSSKCCTLTTRCNRCSGKHKSSECDKINQETKKVPEESLRCIHCKQHHTSSYRKCPERLRIIAEHQQKLQQQNNNRKRNTYVQNVSNYDDNFPHLIKNNTARNNFNVQNAWNVPLNSHVNTQNVSTFTPRQLFQIFNEIVQIASTYKSKSEQLMALTSIYEKYVINE